MKTPAELIEWLDVVARVSSPTITCERAAELAEVMRDMDRTEKRHAREWSDLLGERDYWDSRMEGLERQVEALKQARIAEIDCGQEGICARPPSCQKHWAFRASELARERDEARRELAALRGKAVSDVEVDASVYERPGRGRR